MEVLEAAYTSLEDELSIYRKESRVAIKDKVDEILQVTARRDYCSSIDESFSLNMHYSDTNEAVAKSSGENQLLSLAFIASLVNFSASRQEQQNQLLKPGTMAPLMLDSPFGQLDPTYRESTAKFLPDSSGQVILLLSQTQGDEAVIDVLRDRIGEECVLISEVKSERGSKPEDLINRAMQLTPAPTRYSIFSHGALSCKYDRSYGYVSHRRVMSGISVPDTLARWISLSEVW